MVKEKIVDNTRPLKSDDFLNVSKSHNSWQANVTLAVEPLIILFRPHLNNKTPDFSRQQIQILKEVLRNRYII